ncbi:MAG: hypothetical protein RLZZ142_1321 [Verrucomicrobiota bacterium]
MLPRRHFLSAFSAALAASSLPQRPAHPAADAPRPAFKNPVVTRFTIGDIEAFSISDGFLRFPAPRKIMHPETQRDAMEAALQEEGEAVDFMPSYINTLVLRWEKEVAVIDPGFGPKFRPKFGWLFDVLPELDIRPEQVTAGFLSHAHIDHIGGFVTEGKPTFPNAALHVLQSELDFWFTPEPDFSESLRDPKELPGLIKGNREKFDLLKPQTQALRGSESLWGGRVTVEPAPGHTAGHAIFRISSKGESVLHIADLAHHPVLMLRNPNWFVGLDHHPKAAVATRKQVFAQAAEQHTRIFGFHLSWPGLGRIAKLADGFRWIPERARWG